MSPANHQLIDPADSSTIFPSFIPVFEDIELLPAECFVHSGPAFDGDQIFEVSPEAWVAVKIRLRIGKRTVVLTDERGNIPDVNLATLLQAIQVDFTIFTEGTRAGVPITQSSQEVDTPHGKITVSKTTYAWIATLDIDDERAAALTITSTGNTHEVSIKGATEILCCRPSRGPLPRVSAAVRLKTTELANLFCGRCDARDLVALRKSIGSEQFQKEAAHAVQLCLDRTRLRKMFILSRLSSYGDPACNELSSYPIATPEVQAALAHRALVMWAWSVIAGTGSEPAPATSIPIEAIQAVQAQIADDLLSFTKSELIEPWVGADTSIDVPVLIAIRNRLEERIKIVLDTLADEDFDPPKPSGRLPEQLAKSSKRV